MSIPDEAALRRAIGGVLFNVSNFPEKAQARLLGQDMGPLNDRLTTAIIEGWLADHDAAVRNEALRVAAEAVMCEAHGGAADQCALCVNYGAIRALAEGDTNA